MSDAAVPAKWDATKIQSQKGKRVIVTGANSGIGYVTALELARHGADVVLACRSEEKGKDAVKTIEEELKLSPEAGRVEFRKLDVSSLASVKAFADDFKSKEDRVDLLINNAGIMATPHALTVDGYESQFATNHLGHFALTAQLLELLKKSPHARVVNISSILHTGANMKADEVMTSQKNYNSFTAYANSKLYNLLFTHELNRRLQASGVSNVIATTAHPGFCGTNLSVPLTDNSYWIISQTIKFAYSWVAQTSEFGALPTLYAAVGENVKPSDFIGPNGIGALWGYPSKQTSSSDSMSVAHATTLWEESERLAKIKFEL